MINPPRPSGRDPLDDPRIRRLRNSLSRHTPQPAREADPARPPLHASVALLVRPRPGDLEVLLIRRAPFAGDPWSGHVALPGGRRAPADRSSADTAVRETMEEVGIDLLAVGAELGRLDDVAPRRGGPVIAVTPWVHAVPPDVEVRPNHEVESALWIPARHLADPASAMEHLHGLANGEHVRFPAIGYGDFVIWGLTHRILSQFFEITRGED